MVERSPYSNRIFSHKFGFLSRLPHRAWQVKEIQLNVFTSLAGKTERSKAAGATSEEEMLEETRTLPAKNYISQEAPGERAPRTPTSRISRNRGCHRVLERRERERVRALQRRRSQAAVSR